MRAESSRLFGVRGGTFEAGWFETVDCSRRSGRRSSADSLRAETLVSILDRRKRAGSSCFRISSALRSLSDDRRPCWVRGGTFEAGWFETVDCSRRSGRRSSADSLRAETLVSILDRRKRAGSSCFRISSALRSLSDDRRPCRGRGGEVRGRMVRGCLRFETERFEAVWSPRRSGRH